jgi:hypothetical protein
MDAFESGCLQVANEGQSTDYADGFQKSLQFGGGRHRGLCAGLRAAGTT